jgi:hypothetical protein
MDLVSSRIDQPGQFADHMKSSLNQFVVGGDTWSSLKPSAINNEMTAKMVQDSSGSNFPDIGYMGHGE